MHQRATERNRGLPFVWLCPPFIVCCVAPLGQNKGAKKRTGGEQQRSCCPLRGANSPPFGYYNNFVVVVSKGQIVFVVFFAL